MNSEYRIKKPEANLAESAESAMSISNLPVSESMNVYEKKLFICRFLDHVHLPITPLATSVSLKEHPNQMTSAATASYQKF